MKTTERHLETKPDHTPKEAAYAIAMGWIKNAHEGYTNDLAFMSGPPAYQKAVKRQLAKLYNRLLSQSGMDGIELKTGE